jgi:hypothetical protein
MCCEGHRLEGSRDNLGKTVNNVCQWLVDWFCQARDNQHSFERIDSRSMALRSRSRQKSKSKLKKQDDFQKAIGPWVDIRVHRLSPFAQQLSLMSPSDGVKFCFAMNKDALRRNLGKKSVAVA